MFTGRALYELEISGSGGEDHAKTLLPGEGKKKRGTKWRSLLLNI